uniref:Alpha-carbonic anhydrase domain-containing protein n=1 Tax=Strix occidentalis caurina TaxID=311401 RepID=A0A8D0KUA0_STROC
MDEAALNPCSSIERKVGWAGGQLLRDTGEHGRAGRDSRAGWGPSHPWSGVPPGGGSGCPWFPCTSSAGPSHWKELKATCGGDKQSPVNIDRRRLQRDSGLGDILFEGYDQAPPGTWRLANDGHTVMLSLASESASEHITISGGGLPGRYRALQLHFHWGSPVRNGSEHTLDGHQLPMEVGEKKHPLCSLGGPKAKGHPNGLAVLGFFFQVGLQGLTVPVGGDPPGTDCSQCGWGSIVRTLLPHTGRLSGYYRYQGSLTTPDCSEVVVWTVFEEPVEIGREQVLAFVSTLHFPAAGPVLLKMTNNFRPPQPLRSRKVFASRAATASGGSPCGGRCQLLSPLLLLALLGPFSPTL